VSRSLWAIIDRIAASSADAFVYEQRRNAAAFFVAKSAAFRRNERQGINEALH